MRLVHQTLLHLPRFIRPIQPRRLFPTILPSTSGPYKNVLAKVVFSILDQVPEFVRIKINIGHIVVHVGGEHFVDRKAEIR